MHAKLPGKSFAREPSVRVGYPSSMSEAIVFYNDSLDCCGYSGATLDYPRAFALNVKAAKLGFPDAVLAMGWFYVGGRGVPRSIPLAQHWYRRSARHGQPNAMFSLGQIAFAVGDYSVARLWFERASNHGHMRALYWLGKLAWRGLGMPRDCSAAFALFHRAAHAHEPEAIRALRFLSRRNLKA